MAKNLKVDWDISASPNEEEYPDLIVCDKNNKKKFGLEVRQIFAAEVGKFPISVVKNFIKEQLSKEIKYSTQDEAEEALANKKVGEAKAQEVKNKDIIHGIANKYYEQSQAADRV